MKKIIYSILALVFISANLFSQNKIVESSGKMPKWINGIEKGYIITLGSSSDIEDAKAKAILSVKEIIVTSIADNVKVKTESNTQELNYNNSINSFLETFKSSTSSQSGDVNYLQGISITKVEEYYWEKVYNKTTKTNTYNFHIKYPFSQYEIDKLVAEYKRKDNELTKQLEELIAEQNKVRSIEEIQSNINALESLMESFVDKRKDQAALAISQYKDLLKSIEIIDLGSSLGNIEYGLSLKNRFITTNKKASVTSNCARITDKRTEGDNYIVEYDYSECYDDPDNNIKIKYSSGSIKIEKEFYFDITELKAKVNVSNSLLFQATSKDDVNINSANCTITLNSKYDSPFVVERVILQWENESPVIVENLNIEFSGEGNHLLKFSFDQAVSIETTSSKNKTIPAIKGTIQYKSVKGGQVKNLKIYNQAYSTDW